MNKIQLKDMINEVMGEMARKSLKLKLKTLIFESIEELKEDSECIVTEMDKIDKLVKENNKDCGVEKDDKGNYNINGIPPHSFSIRPMSAGIYDVVYFKDTTDRTKKQNLKFEELKEFIKEKLTNKDLNYVKSAYNKSAENNKDQIEKGELPRVDIVKRHEVKDTKTDDKNYTEQAVKKDEDLPTKPMREVEKTKKQSDHPIKGTKPDYTQPKLDKKQSKLMIKLKSRGKTKKLS
jgi:hypothetical protein